MQINTIAVLVKIKIQIFLIFLYDFYLFSKLSDMANYCITDHFDNYFNTDHFANYFDTNVSKAWLTFESNETRLEVRGVGSRS